MAKIVCASSLYALFLSVLIASVSTIVGYFKFN